MNYDDPLRKNSHIIYQDLINKMAFLLPNISCELAAYFYITNNMISTNTYFTILFGVSGVLFLLTFILLNTSFKKDIFSICAYDLLVILLFYLVFLIPDLSIKNLIPAWIVAKGSIAFVLVFRILWSFKTEDGYDVVGFRSLD